MRVSVACFLVPKHLSPWGVRSVFPGVEGEENMGGEGREEAGVVQL
jgi:hypothetical protein